MFYNFLFLTEDLLKRQSLTPCPYKLFLEDFFINLNMGIKYKCWFVHVSAVPRKARRGQWIS